MSLREVLLGCALLLAAAVSQGDAVLRAMGWDSRIVADTARDVTLTGSLDGRRDGIELAPLTVHINGVAAATTQDGRFTATVPAQPYFRVDIAGAGIFPAVQTFGELELRDERCDCLAIPAIELVAKKPGRVELFFGGDAMAGRRYFVPREDGEAVLDNATLDSDLDALFAHIRPYLQSADMASINLESVVAKVAPAPPAPKKYLFYTPPEIAPALKRAGIDHVSLGNNHTADYRGPGVRTTIDALDAGGVAHSGAGMDVAQAEAAWRTEVGGQKLSVYGFVGWRGTWTPNQIATQTKAGAAWGTAGAIRRVTRRELAAGYIPVMQYHGGLEYSDRHSDMTDKRYRTGIDAGAPLVIAHHPHVTQGLELYRGGLIAHSLGNFLFDQDHPHTHVSYGLKVWLQDGAFLRAEAVPLQILDYRPVPATGAMREASLRRLYWLSSEKGTTLHQTGGHAALWADGFGGSPERCVPARNWSLARLAPVCVGEGEEPGRNTIPRGDFENVRVGAALERYWRTHAADHDFRTLADGGTVLALRPESAGAPFVLMTRSYIRDLYARRFTVTARMRVPRDVRIDVLAKGQPDQGSWTPGPHRGYRMASTVVRATGEWQDVALDFSRAEVKPGVAWAFRPILKFTYLDRVEGQRGEEVLIDDFAMVEWPDEAIAADPHRRWHWTHARSVQ